MTMVKKMIGALAIFSASTYSSPSNCLLEKMTPMESNVISFFHPFNSCNEVRAETGELVGLKIIKEKSVITASYGNHEDFHPDSLSITNSIDRASTRDLFWNLFSDNNAINKFVEIQRERLKGTKVKGILIKKDTVAFYEIGAKSAPEPHSITYFFDPEMPDRYFSLGFTNIDEAKIMSLALKME
ncbi:hypothetical protein HR060_05645 [Catenovulum sp. SM1970]|uniref:hypothetical protein n=1 Tax=Marinifaba aquimaris TaxID=2741323 RepID=UPI001574B531|nr:hypothetical protein [Marinifaba aquimaris]NTS76347.1 hypothetical protein [Marinifaba aquimaris]